MATYSPSGVIQVSGSLEILEATVKILALKNSVFKTIFSHQSDELYRAIL